MATKLWESMVQQADQFVEAVEEVTSVLFKSTSDTHSEGAEKASPIPDIDVSEIFGNDATADASAEAAEQHGSSLMGAADNVLRDAFAGSVGPQTFREHIAAFSSAINWGEPFIRCLLALHVVMILLAVIFSRKKIFGGQVATFGLLATLVWRTEWLNTYGAAHWRDFATQNYFDKGGVFVGVMYAAPLMLICLCMIIDMVHEASGLLVQVKRLEIKKKEQKNMNGTENPKKVKRRSKKED